MPPSKYTRCDILKNKPWYVNEKRRTAKKIHIGDAKGLYYNAPTKNGKSRKTYIETRCKTHGTKAFWKKINYLRENIHKNHRIKKPRQQKVNKTIKSKLIKQSLSPKNKTRSVNKVSKTQIQNMQKSLQKSGIHEQSFVIDVCNVFKQLIRMNNNVWTDAGLIALDNQVPVLSNVPRPCSGNCDIINMNAFETKGVYLLKNRIISHNLIGSGTYADIFSGTYVNKKVVLKLPKLPSPLNYDSKLRYLIDFYMECMVHTQMYCDLIQNNKVSYQKASIPKPEFFCKYKLGQHTNDERNVFGLEPLEGSLYQWINGQNKNHHTTIFKKQLKDMFIAIANLLVDLQKKYQFYHRDLHMANIMYKKTGNHLQWYIIDFGMVTMTINRQRINTGKSNIYPEMPNTANWHNRGHDLRILILSLLNVIHIPATDPLMIIINDIQQTAIKDLNKHQIYMNKETIFHRAYGKALTQIQSPKTTPLAIIDTFKHV